MTTTIQHTVPEELYYPEMAEIISIKQYTELEKKFELVLPAGKDLGHLPGQFALFSIFGYGEAAISICSDASKKGAFDICVRKVGLLTAKMHQLEVGQKIGVRGPYGNGFPVDSFKGKDIIIMGGGIGIVPLRSLINHVINQRSDYGRLIILYGAKNPGELLFPEDRESWSNDPQIEFHLTVDNGSPEWTGNTGVITTLIPGLDLDLRNTVAAVVGPPVMYKFALMALKSKRLSDKNIFLSLERRMKCGVGKCGHCQINDSYVCQDGPVYNYTELINRPEAF